MSAKPDTAKAKVFANLSYDPHPKQWMFHNSNARFKVAACGRRFGKSNMAAAELFVNKRANIFQPEKLFWIVGRKYINSAKEFKYLMLFLKKMPGRSGVPPPKGKSLWDECPSKGYNPKQGDMHVTLPWGTEIIALSAQHKDNLIGEGVDGVIVSESARVDFDIIHEHVGPTLTDKDPLSWMIMPSTPQGFNWFHDEYQRGQKKSMQFDPDYESWNFPSWDNPYLYPEGENDPKILKTKERLVAAGQEDVFWQEYGASFRSVVGLVYGEFDEELHIYEQRFGRPEYEYRPEWPNFTSIDFGFTNPLVVLDIQVDPMDNVYVWREHYLSKHSTPQHISIIKGRPDPKGYHVRCGFGDAAYPDGIEQFSMNLWAVNADNIYKDWQRGVDEVKELLLGEDGGPHLFISKACPNTIWEFQNYRLKEKPSDDQNTKEEPKKFADHALDALRYFVMGYFVYGGGRYSLADVMTPTTGPIDDMKETGYFTLDNNESFSMDVTY